MSSESLIVSVVNVSGIHARPAAFLSKLAKSYNNIISVKSLTNNKIADAKSVISILGLGLACGDEVEIIVDGEERDKLLSVLKEAFLSGLGEGGNSDHKKNTTDPKLQVKEQVRILDFTGSKSYNFTGKVASPGLATGVGYLKKEFQYEVDEYASDSKTEKEILAKVIFDTKLEIESEIKSAKKYKLKVQQQVLTAHLELLEDISMLSNAHEQINKGKSAAYSWRRATHLSIAILTDTNNAFLKERIADLKDMQLRVLRGILGITEDLHVFDENTILIAEDLVPSDVVNLHIKVKGVLLTHGSGTSHVALLLRNKGVPCLVNVGGELLQCDGRVILLNGIDGTLLCNASKTEIENFYKLQIAKEKISQENIHNAFLPALTTNGVEVLVKANISEPKEGLEAYKLGATGIGLLRSEFLFFNSISEPSVETQIKIYQECLDIMQGYPVVIRTLDVGGDKNVSFLHIDKEENPIMGLRGVRNYFANIELIRRHFKAILSVKPIELVYVMIPMICDIKEFLDIKEVILEEARLLNIDITKLHIGTMVEIPSTAIMMDVFAPHIDFCSIGTNDLAQYLFAIDRGNYKLDKYLSNLHPSLLRVIKSIVDCAKKTNLPVAICGAMASEILSVPILLGLGITELSVSRNSVADIKALIRKLDTTKCEKLAINCLSLPSSLEVEVIAKNFIKDFIL